MPLKALTVAEIQLPTTIHHSQFTIHNLQFVIFPLLLILAPTLAFNQSVTGKWKTIDDVTGKPRSVIEIYEKNGAVYGKVLKIFYRPGEKEDPVCDKCDPSDSRYNKKIIGMDVIVGLKKDGNEWSNGTILDPDNGKVYDCKIWVVGTQNFASLQVRGYILFFFRTQTWLPGE